MAMAADPRAYLKDVATRMDGAGKGEKATVVNDACSLLGWSKSRLYRQLRAQVGWSSGRGPRADKGYTKQDLHALKSVAAMQRESVRKNGKQVMFTPVSIGIAHHNDIPIAVSGRQVNRLMADRRMNVAAQQHSNAAVDMRAPYPNHTHQVDPSLCLVYYAKGEQHIIEDDEFYKNKMDAFAKVVFKCWRYVLVDRASNWTVVRYYAAHGETTKNLFDFLMYAWSQKPAIPFHGVPNILVWDKGSANGAAAIKTMLAAIDVAPIAHTKGNARAKGSVENGNNRVECQFECRLKYQPVKSVDELNSYAETWMVVYNGNLDPRQDTRLRRELIAPVARTGLWLKIRSEQLRFLPDIEACRSALLGKESTRKVRNMKLSYKHPQADRSSIYLLDGCDGICNGDTVFVRPQLFGKWAVTVRVERYDGADITHRVEPFTDYDEFGQRMDAAVFGEGFKSLRDTDADRMGKTLDRIAYPDAATTEDIQKSRDKKEPPLKGLNTLDYMQSIAVPSYLPKRGVDLPIAAAPEVAPLKGIALMKLLAARLGHGLTADENRAIKTRYPDGMTEDEIQSWLASYGRPEPTALRAVN